MLLKPQNTYRHWVCDQRKHINWVHHHSLFCVLPLILFHFTSDFDNFRYIYSFSLSFILMKKKHLHIASWFVPFPYNWNRVEYSWGEHQFPHHPYGIWPTFSNLNIPNTHTHTHALIHSQMFHSVFNKWSWILAKTCRTAKMTIKRPIQFNLVD